VELRQPTPLESQKLHEQRVYHGGFNYPDPPSTRILAVGEYKTSMVVTRSVAEWFAY